MGGIKKFIICCNIIIKCATRINLQHHFNKISSARRLENPKQQEGLEIPHPCLHLRQEVCIALLMDVGVSLFVRPGEHFRSDPTDASMRGDLELVSDRSGGGRYWVITYNTMHECLCVKQVAVVFPEPSI